VCFVWKIAATIAAGCRGDASNGTRSLAMEDGAIYESPMVSASEEECRRVHPVDGLMHHRPIHSAVSTTWHR
jgi:hypothetical protein